ncbi:hypothetical protein J6590_036203 [Homalodisca vitripennis]|nr:hypothetical protein J6590_036203 [Homalodisca vitripennis]
MVERLAGHDNDDRAVACEAARYYPDVGPKLQAAACNRPGVCPFNSRLRSAADKKPMFYMVPRL